MGEVAYPLRGEVINDRSVLEYLEILQNSTSGGAPYFSSWHAPLQAGTYWNVNASYAGAVPYQIAEIKVSRGGSFLANTAVSVVKIHFLPIGGQSINGDSVVMTTNWQCRPIFGADMPQNVLPSTASTNSTYSLILNQEPDSIHVWTTNRFLGKCKFDIAAYMFGQFEIVVWDGYEHGVIRVDVRGTYS